MKLSEFETKLGTVSDAKLRQMLAASRAGGPEAAVKLILAECERRGMDDLQEAGWKGAATASVRASTGAPGAFASEEDGRNPASATAAYPQEHAGYDGADAPPANAPREPGIPEGSVPNGDAVPEDPALSDAPATAPSWLNEEAKTGLPVFLKVLILLLIIGAVVGAAWKFSR